MKRPEIQLSTEYPIDDDLSNPRSSFIILSREVENPCELNGQPAGVKMVEGEKYGSI